MITEFVINEPKIRYKGIMDFDGLYKFVKSFLEGKDYFVEELGYKDKGEDIEIKWHAVKNVTEYFQYEINIIFRAWGMSKTQIIDERTAKARTVDSGRIEVLIKGQINEDYLGNWEKNWLNKKLHVLYRLLIKSQRDEVHAKNIRGDVIGLVGSIKSRLNL